MGTMDSSIILISLPALTNVFQTTPSIALWVALSYTLVMPSILLTLGRVADVLGRKNVYCWGFVVFTVGLALCSVAQDIFQLIFFRVIEAIGAAMLAASSNALITDSFPGNERGKAMGLNEAIAGVGLVSGPALGGLLLGVLDWRAIFYTRIPIGVLGSAAAWWLLKEEASSERHQRFDFWGAATLFVGLSTLLLAINQGEGKGWTSVFVLTFLATGVLLLLLFVVIESRVRQPVMQLSLFRNWPFATGNSMLFFYYMVAMAVAFLIPFYLISGAGRPPAQAGLLVMTSSAVLLLVSPISGWLSDRIGPKFPMTAGAGIQCLAAVLLSQLNIDSTVTDVVLRLALLGLGSGLFLSPGYSTVMGSVPRQRLGTASAMIATMRTVGFTFGLGIGGAVLASRTAYHLEELTSSGSGLPEVLRPLALVGGYHDTVLVTAGFSFVAMLISFAAWRKARPQGQGAVAESPPRT